MNEDQIKQMADEYAAKYIPMYQKVVKIAFTDGIKASMEMDVFAREVVKSMRISRNEMQQINHGKKEMVI